MGRSHACHMHVTWLTVTNRIWLFKLSIVSTSKEAAICSVVTSVTNYFH